MDKLEDVPGDYTKYWDDGTLRYTRKNVTDWLTDCSDKNVYEDVELFSVKPKWHYSKRKTPVKEWKQNTYARRVVKNLKYKYFPKWLSFALYEQLRFQEHVNKTEKK